MADVDVLRSLCEARDRGEIDDMERARMLDAIPDLLASLAKAEAERERMAAHATESMRLRLGAEDRTYTAEAQASALRRALEYYANSANWIAEARFAFLSKAALDSGEVARIALSLDAGRELAEEVADLRARLDTGVCSWDAEDGSKAHECPHVKDAVARAEKAERDLAAERERGRGMARYIERAPRWIREKAGPLHVPAYRCACDEIATGIEADWLKLQRGEPLGDPIMGAALRALDQEPRPAKPKRRCGTPMGDNDGTCPQLTCIREEGHAGLCDNVSDAPDADPKK
jgi:hypothetical protein